MKHLLVVLALVSLAGCGGSETSTPGTNDTGTPTDTGGSDTGGSDTGANDTGGSDSPGKDDAAGKPNTPEIVSVVKMAGNLHVTWKTNDTGLTNVELLRNKDGGEFTKILTLPGTAKDQHDSTAVAPGTYCYKVVTVRGIEKSDPSPEKCGTP